MLQDSQRLVPHRLVQIASAASTTGTASGDFVRANRPIARRRTAGSLWAASSTSMAESLSQALHDPLTNFYFNTVNQTRLNHRQHDLPV